MIQRAPNSESQPQTQKKPGLLPASSLYKINNHEQPLVDPHVSHFKHVPLRTIV
jgi:hypothetical protein